MRNTHFLACTAAVAAAASCGGGEDSGRSGASPSCDDPQVLEVARALGAQLKRVSLQAPDTVAAREIRQAYAPYVTADLLEKWISEPASAPGRHVSSPWPERLEHRAVHPAGPGNCHVDAELIYQSSAPSPDSAMMRAPVTLMVRHGDAGWRVSAFDMLPRRADSTSAAGATDVLRSFYDAINARDFASAYALRERGVRPRQTLDEFAAGFARTVRSDIEIGQPGRIEGAAGSRYVKVPVVVRAVTTSGEEQRFEGTYTLRSSVVDGAPPEARRWRIYDAELVPAP